MRELNQLVDMMVACARESGAEGMSMSLRAGLVRLGMSDDELSLLLEVVALEVRVVRLSTIVPIRRRQSTITVDATVG